MIIFHGWWFEKVWVKYYRVLCHVTLWQASQRWGNMWAVYGTMIGSMANIEKGAETFRQKNAKKEPGRKDVYMVRSVLKHMKFKLQDLLLECIPSISPCVLQDGRNTQKNEILESWSPGHDGGHGTEWDQQAASTPSLLPSAPCPLCTLLIILILS